MGNGENVFTRVQNERSMPVEPECVIEAEPADNGDAVPASHDTSPASEDEPH
jgi:hypothetical protein